MRERCKCGKFKPSGKKKCASCQAISELKKKLTKSRNKYWEEHYNKETLSDEIVQCRVKIDEFKRENAELRSKQATPETHPHSVAIDGAFVCGDESLVEFNKLMSGFGKYIKFFNLKIERNR